MNYTTMMLPVFFIFLVVRCEPVQTGKAVGEMVRAYNEAVEKTP